MDQERLPETCSEPLNRWGEPRRVQGRPSVAGRPNGADRRPDHVEHPEVGLNRLRSGSHPEEVRGEAGPAHRAAMEPQIGHSAALAAERILPDQADRG